MKYERSKAEVIYFPKDVFLLFSGEHGVYHGNGPVECGFKETLFPQRYTLANCEDVSSKGNGEFSCEVVVCFNDNGEALTGTGTLYCSSW